MSRTSLRNKGKTFGWKLLWHLEKTARQPFENERLVGSPLIWLPTIEVYGGGDFSTLEWCTIIDRWSLDVITKVVTSGRTRSFSARGFVVLLESSGTTVNRAECPRTPYYYVRDWHDRTRPAIRFPPASR